MNIYPSPRFQGIQLIRSISESEPDDAFSKGHSQASSTIEAFKEDGVVAEKFIYREPADKESGKPAARHIGVAWGLDAFWLMMTHAAYGTLDGIEPEMKTSGLMGAFNETHQAATVLNSKADKLAYLQAQNHTCIDPDPKGSLTYQELAERLSC